MSLAIFDLDETLIAADTCSLFCQFLVDEGLAGAAFIEQDQRMMELYNAEQLVLSDYVAFLVSPLQQMSCAEIDALMPVFVEKYVVSRIYPQARDMLTQLQQQAHRTLIISATPEFIVRAVANSLGVKDVLAIRLETEGHFYTGKIDGVPTFREGKVTRLKRWLEDQQESLDGAQFYSDSINDLPLLEQVQFPVATNPDGQLLAIANNRDWPVLNWSRPPFTESNPNAEKHFTEQEPTHV